MVRSRYNEQRNRNHCKCKSAYFDLFPAYWTYLNISSFMLIYLIRIMLIFMCYDKTLRYMTWIFLDFRQYIYEQLQYRMLSIIKKMMNQGTGVCCSLCCGMMTKMSLYARGHSQTYYSTLRYILIIGD